jgi:predicted MFS family arabinose efflux permease
MARNKLLSGIPLSLPYALGFLSSTIMPVWVSSMAQRHSLSLATVGFIASLELACVALASILSASLLDTRATRRPIATAIIISILANVAAAGAPTVVLFTLARGVAGLTHGFILSDITRRAAQVGNPQRIFAAQLFAIVVCSIVFFVNAPFLLSQLGAGAPFLFCAALGVLALASLTLLEPPQTDQQSRRKRQTDSSVPRSSIILSLAGVSLPFCVQASLWAYLTSAADHAGLPLARLATVLAIGAGANLLAPIAADRLSERAAGGTPLVIGFSGLALSAFLIGGQSSPLWFAAGVIGLPFFNILLGPLLMGALVKLDGSGKIAAAGQAFFMGGLALGPTLGGLVWSQGGVTALAWFGVCVAVLALFLLRVGAVKAQSAPPGNRAAGESGGAAGR